MQMVPDSTQIELEQHHHTAVSMLMVLAWHGIWRALPLSTCMLLHGVCSTCACLARTLCACNACKLAPAHGSRGISRAAAVPARDHGARFAGKPWWRAEDVHDTATEVACRSAEQRALAAAALTADDKPETT